MRDQYTITLEQELQAVLDEAQEHFFALQQNPLHTRNDYESTLRRFMFVVAQTEKTLNAVDTKDAPAHHYLLPSSSQAHEPFQKDEGAMMRLKSIDQELQLGLPRWMLEFIADIETIPSIHAQAWDEASQQHLIQEFEQCMQNNTLSAEQKRSFCTVAVYLFLLRAAKAEKDQYLSQALSHMQQFWKQRFAPVAFKYQALIDFLPHIIILLREYHKNDSI